MLLTIINISDQTFEMTYCPNCNHSERLIFHEKDQCCTQCDTLLEYQCERCDKRYKGLKALRFHLKHDCAKPARFKCAQCDYKTTRKASLQLHIKCKHTNVIKRHACATCGRLFKHRFHMLSHQRYCGPENNLKCNWCNYSTDNKWAHKQHIRNIHMDPRKLAMYMCISCGKKYKHLNSLRKHKDACSFSGTCAHCGFVTPSKTTLQTHIRKFHALKLFDSSQLIMPIRKKIMSNKKKTSKKSADDLKKISSESKIIDEPRTPRKKSLPKRYAD